MLTPSSTGFSENLPFLSLERVFSVKVLPYSFFQEEECLTDRKEKKMPWTGCIALPEVLPIFMFFF